ncbi:hypothetical protein B0H11DRAFT_1017033 [Mycena galericulata]|nr:hypothetical protein B0H11DRAFT_1017033 [Mycena galericulata]
MGQDPGYILADKPDDINDVETLLHQSIPYLEWTADSPLYRPSTIHAALMEFDACCDPTPLLTSWIRKAAELPAFMEMAETLQAAASKYRHAKSQIEQKNRTYLSTLAKRNGLTFNQLVTSPALARQVNAFARDLTTFSDSAWDTICDVVLAEVSVRPKTGRVACPFCDNRKFQGDLLQGHIQLAHPQHFVEIATTKHRCTLCLDSTRQFDLRGIRKHVKASHLAVRKDLPGL